MQSAAPTVNVYLNQQKYALSITLVNAYGNQFFINNASLVEMQLIDDGLIWYKSGTLLIRNPENILEKRPSTLVGTDANYLFSNDGRDIIKFKLTAIVDKDGAINPVQDKLYNMEYVFVVYEKEDVVTGNSTRDKLLRLSFWEAEYQLFYETSLDWSTNNVLKAKTNTPSYLLKDEERKVYTGEAIKDLIKTTLNINNNSFSQDWDVGGSKIFYNSLANNNAIDDLEYLLNRHVSSTSNSQLAGDPCLLIKNRFNENKWMLISLANLYKRATVNDNAAGSLYTETFSIAGPSESTQTNIPASAPVPASGWDKIIYQSPQNSVITNFEFEDAAAIDNINLMINYPCYYNDLKSKTFGVDFTDNLADTVKEYVQKNYAKRVLSKSVSTITLNNAKTEIKNIKQDYSFQNNKTARLPDGRNKIIKAMTYFNQYVFFSVPGALFRESNTFIGIKRSQNTVENNFDNKLLGVWKIDRIIHNFTDQSYTNSIYASKLYTNDVPLTR